MRSPLTRGRKVRKRRGRPILLQFPARTRLIEAGEASRYVYLLRSGLVKLSTGQEAVVDYITPGNFLGEKAFLTPSRSSQIAETLSPVTVIAFRKSELLARLRRDRRFAQRLLKSLGRRLDRAEQTIQAFVIDPAERRLARLLLRFVPASAVSGWVRLRFSPTNSELARTIGTTRWRVAHFMRRFQELGWLARRPGLWALCEGLQEFLETTPTLRSDMGRMRQ